MDNAGQKLKRAREKLKLTYRDVEEASQQIARRRGTDEFAIALSRLADIENKGTLPSIFRLFSLCAIYRLDFEEVLRWYGVPMEQLHAEALHTGLDHTHPVHFRDYGPVTLPQPLEQEIDLNKTSFLSHLIRRWGKMPLSFLNGLELRQYRYGFIGLEDWSMYPLLHPGSLVVIDDGRRKIAASGWSNELERPIYFLEHRAGYICGWCTQLEDRLLVQPHPASHQKPEIFEAGTGIDVIGQVVGVAMIIDSRRRRPPRTSTAPAKSPSP